MGSGKGPKPSAARTVHIEDAVWDRVMEVAFRSRPRRSASDVVREVLDRGLPLIEEEVLGKKAAS